MKCFEQVNTQYDKDLLFLINNVNRFMDKYSDSNTETTLRINDKIMVLLDSLFINKRKIQRWRNQNR